MHPKKAVAEVYGRKEGRGVDTARPRQRDLNKNFEKVPVGLNAERK